MREPSYDGGVTQVLSLVCRRRPAWLTRCLGVDDARQLSTCHVTQTSSFDDAQQHVRDVTADVSQCGDAATEMCDRHVVDNEADDNDYGGSDLTAI